MSHPPPRVPTRAYALVATIALGPVACVSAGVAEPEYAAGAPPPTSAASADAPTATAVPAELGPTPDLPALLRVAEVHAPRLAAARAALTAAEGRAWQSELWPNPTVRLEARDVPRDRMSLDEGQSWLVLMQPLSFSGRRGATIDASRSDRAAAELVLDAVRRSLYLDVVTSWADALLATGLRDETRSLSRISRREAELALARVAAGSLTEPEAYGARVEAEKAVNEERAAAREVEASLERLRSVVGAPAPFDDVAAASVAAAPLPPPAEFRRLVLEKGPAVALLRRKVEAATHRLASERAARVPDVDLMVAIGRDDAMGGGLVEAGVSFPLPVFDRNQGRIREAHAMLAESRAELARAEAELDAEAVADLAALAAAEDALASWRDRLVPAAERVHAQIAAGVSSGTRPETEGLAAERRLVEARIELLRAEREFRRAEAEVWSHLPTELAPGRGVGAERGTR